MIYGRFDGPATALCIIAFAMAGFAKADVITIYDLSGSLNDGGDTLTVNGSFDYDPSTDAVTNWNLTIMLGSSTASAPFCGTSSVCYTFEPGADASASFTPDLFEFIGPGGGGITDTLLIVPGNSSPLPDGTYTLDSSSELTTLSQTGQFGSAAFISGTLAAETGTQTDVSEPSPMATVTIATLLCVAFARRRRPDRRT